MTVDLRKTKITMVWTDTPSTDDLEENLEITDPDETSNILPCIEEDPQITEPGLPGLAETPNTIDSAETLQNTETNPTETSCTNDPAQNLQITEQNALETSKAVRPAVNLAITALKMAETNSPNCMEEAMLTESIQEETINAKFLKALKKTRKNWENDKKFAKIVQKMKKGKNLKRKEFDRLYFLLREKGQYQ